MNVLLAAAFAFFALAGGTMAKNKVEDELASSGDSFTKWDALFRKYAALYGVSSVMLKAIAMNESSLGEYATVKHGIDNPSDVEGSKSQDGKSWGLMQMTIPTARDYDKLASAQKLNDPDYSVRLAAQHIRNIGRLFPMVDARWEEWVVKSYNQGQGNTGKEFDGKSPGYAHEYWARYQRNKRIVESKQGSNL